MKKQILITILDDLVNRLDEAIEVVESQLPDEMKEEVQEIIGTRTIYPIMGPLWTLSGSIERMLENLREE